jgi:hypothetical protein
LAQPEKEEIPMPDPRRKDQRRKDDIPAAVLGGFLREDRRKADRRRKKDASPGTRSRPKGR